MSDSGIDVYRIGIGKDIHHLRAGIITVRHFVQRTIRNGRARSHWGVWQAESEVIPVNAARGLTARSARRRLTRRITKVMSP